MRTSIQRAGTLICLAAIGGVAAGQTPVPIGPQFQVNEHVVENQEAPAVVATAPGEFAVAWRSDSYHFHRQYHDVFMRRMAADGGPLASEVLVEAAYSVGEVDVASRDGRFVVAWDSSVRLGSYEARSQGFEADGTALSPNFFGFESEYGHHALHVSIAELTDSEFIVSWNFFRLGGQRVASDGSDLGADFVLYTPEGNEYNPAVARGAGDGFLVAWGSRAPGPAPFEYSIRGGRFERDGTPIGATFQVNSEPLSESGLLRLYPRIASKANGTALIVWANDSSPGMDSEGWSVLAARLGADGQILGQDFQVNSCAAGDQLSPRVAAVGGSDFIVVWRSDGDCLGDPTKGISGQRISAGGERIGSEFLVNQYTTSWQGRPDVAALDQGRFVVTWDSAGSYGEDTDGASIQARVFELPDFVFADGFESGDGTAWTEVLP